MTAPQRPQTDTPLEFEAANLSNADYHAVRWAFSSSFLKKAHDKSVRRAWVELNTPRDETKPNQAFVFGSAAHELILEGEDVFASHYAVAKHDWRTKIGKEEKARFEEENLTKLTSDEMNALVAMNKAVQFHRTASDILATATDREKSFFWKDPESGLWCRIRTDAFDEANQRIVDLKTTNDIYDFSREATKFGYALQAAFYIRGIRDVLEHEGVEANPTFAFVAVDKTAPHEVAVFEYDDASLAWADREVQKLLNRIASDIDENSLEADDGFSSGIISMSVPRRFLEPMTAANSGNRPAFDPAMIPTSGISTSL